MDILERALDGNGRYIHSPSRYIVPKKKRKRPSSKRTNQLADRTLENTIKKAPQKEPITAEGIISEKLDHFIGTVDSPLTLISDYKLGRIAELNSEWHAGKDAELCIAATALVKRHIKNGYRCILKGEIADCINKYKDAMKLIKFYNADGKRDLEHLARKTVEKAIDKVYENSQKIVFRQRLEDEFYEVRQLADTLELDYSTQIDKLGKHIVGKNINDCRKKLLSTDFYIKEIEDYDYIVETAEKFGVDMIKEIDDLAVTIIDYKIKEVRSLLNGYNKYLAPTAYRNIASFADRIGPDLSGKLDELKSEIGEDYMITHPL